MDIHSEYPNYSFIHIPMAEKVSIIFREINFDSCLEKASNLSKLVILWKKRNNPIRYFSLTRNEPWTMKFKF